jgi:hypothetical protein
VKYEENENAFEDYGDEVGGYANQGDYGLGYGVP